MSPRAARTIKPAEPKRTRSVVEAEIAKARHDRAQGLALLETEAAMARRAHGSGLSPAEMRRVVLSAFQMNELLIWTLNAELADLMRPSHMAATGTHG